MNQVKIFLFIAILFLLKTQASEFKIQELVCKSRTYLEFKSGFDGFIK